MDTKYMQHKLASLKECLIDLRLQQLCIVQQEECGLGLLLGPLAPGMKPPLNVYPGHHMLLGDQ